MHRRSTTQKTTFRAVGSDTFVASEKVRVGSDLVPAYHYRVERTVSGSQTGSERDDVWYSVLDGLPIRSVRSVVVHSPSPIGTVTYTEQGSYGLTSLVPRR